MDKTKLYECDDKMVSHPKHYQSSKGLEVIDVIEAFTENLHGIEATDTGNIIRYICRWKEKNGVQDLRKILWYTTHLINHLEEENRKTVTTTLTTNVPEDTPNKEIYQISSKNTPTSSPLNYKW